MLFLHSHGSFRFEGLHHDRQNDSTLSGIAVFVADALWGYFVLKVQAHDLLP